MKRTLTTLTLLSGIVLCFLVVMWPVSYFMDLSRNFGTGKLAPSDSIPVSPDYRMGFERGSLWLYTYAMPYRGGIVWMSSTNDPPPQVHEWSLGGYGFGHSVHSNKTDKLSKRYCDLPGVSFLSLWHFDDKPPYTTLELSLWYPILPLAVLPVLWFYRRRYSRFGSHENDA